MGLGTTNPGKRERVARKRSKRARVWSFSMGAEAVPLKLGRKHFQRWLNRNLAVADSRKVRGTARAGVCP